MKAVQDFNYKVALASGLKHLQGGKLRQAEEQFRYLVSKFPQADGGYRGLARVQVEVGDHPAAVATLRDGAAALSRSGERGLAIDLLGEATSLDPLDLSAHRRLAAALALAGDVGASAAEYVRFANAEIAAGDPDRAKLEANYALETLGEIPALHDLARTVGLQLRTVRRLAPEPVPVPEPFVMPEREPVAPEPAWASPCTTRSASSSASRARSAGTTSPRSASASSIGPCALDRIQQLVDTVLQGRGFGWNNVVDIFLVGVFLYYVFVLIRGTRAVQLLLGVLVLAAIYGIAVRFNLTVTALVLQFLSVAALVALPVIFQPELRRALGQLGRLGALDRLLAPTSEEEVDVTVDEVVRGALLIRQQGNGALIVIERGTGLQDYSETGVPVNGKLTAELLASIFMARSPLHDGAVIVRSAQVHAAACLLPLDETPERFAHRYGMRHRAALSISSQSDAVVVVVSEESGTISIASNGRMIGNLDEERLRRVLSSLLRSRIQPLPFRTKAS